VTLAVPIEVHLSWAAIELDDGKITAGRACGRHVASSIHGNCIGRSRGDDLAPELCPGRSIKLDHGKVRAGAVIRGAACGHNVALSIDGNRTGFRAVPKDIGVAVGVVDELTPEFSPGCSIKLDHGKVAASAVIRGRACGHNVALSIDGNRTGDIV